MAIGEVGYAELVDPALVQRSYELYGALTAEYSRLSPQHQGLTAEEFGAALGDTAVAKTDLQREGQRFLLPQIGPVDRNEWLNHDYYERTFPQEYPRGDVLYYVDIPGVEPGEEVRDRIKTLAATDGVLVFDYPEADPDYPERISGLLTSLGVETAATTLLGNQTYFAGQLYLKNGVDPTKPVLPFPEAFKKFIAEGKYDSSRIDNGASLMPSVPDDQAQLMRDFYDAAYQVLNDHPCVQGLNPDEFMEMVTQKEWVTKIVNSRMGSVAALCLLDNNLEELSWVNENYYKEHYPEKYEKGQVMWVPGLAADPEGNMGGNLLRMVKLMAELFEAGNNESIVVFDCCDKNTGKLDVQLEAMINKTPQTSIAFETIAVQRYMALKLKAA